MFLIVLMRKQENGHTAIHVAAERGNVDIARHLIETFPEIRDLEDKVLIHCMYSCSYTVVMLCRKETHLLKLPG